MNCHSTRCKRPGLWSFSSGHVASVTAQHEAGTFTQGQKFGNFTCARNKPPPPPSQAPSRRRYMRSVNGKKRRFKDKRKRRAKRRDVAASEMDLQGGTVEKRRGQADFAAVPLREQRVRGSRVVVWCPLLCVVSLVLAQLALVLPTTINRRSIANNQRSRQARHCHRVKSMVWLVACRANNLR